MTTVDPAAPVPVTMPPSLVLGPSLTMAGDSGSTTTMQHFVDMSMSLGAPALDMGVVDVRDAARAWPLNHVG